MPYYRSVGEVPRKRHTAFRHDDGLYIEELMGAEGFSAESALLYHRHSPSAIVHAMTVGDDRSDAFTPNEPLLPYHLRTSELPLQGDVVTDRRPLMGNADVTICFAVTLAASMLYRSVVGDELVFVHRGSGRFESVFGTIAVGQGDYVVIPSGTTHRWVPDDGEHLQCLVVEANGHIGPPDRYLSKGGQFLEHAPYCERDIRTPEGPLLVDEGDVQVLVRHKAGRTRYVYDQHPFDVVGWDGSLYPWAFNIADFEPIVGRVHQPPPVHQTFQGPGFVVCSFVPRLFDFHPDAIKVPYHHANVDSDEVLLYVDGDFMSRAGSGIEAGSISLHPTGFIHGPQPGSVEASLNKAGTEEIAVMIDTFRPLGLSNLARAIADKGYPFSWSKRRI
ncbi:MAG TPA: homogentisate 1,2-dioxygenase [Acidimicrobiales bacterium]